MKRQNYLTVLVLLLAGLSFVGCKKDKKEDPKPAPAATEMTIHQVQVLDYPSLNSEGLKWDELVFSENSKLPDLIIEIEAKQDIITYLYSSVLNPNYMTGYYNNVDKSKLPFDVSPHKPVKITQINQPITLYLLDDDGLGGNDTLGTIEFNPANFAQSRPSSLTFPSGNDTNVVKLTLGVSWN